MQDKNFTLTALLEYRPRQVPLIGWLIGNGNEVTLELHTQPDGTYSLELKGLGEEEALRLQQQFYAEQHKMADGYFIKLLVVGTNRQECVQFCQKLGKLVDDNPMFDNVGTHFTTLGSVEDPSCSYTIGYRWYELLKSLAKTHLGFRLPEPDEKLPEYRGNGHMR